jgi:tetratricopeptide (TPR) repeat protein
MGLKKLGDVKLEATDNMGAIAAYEEGVVFWRRVLKGDPDNVRWISAIAESLERIGDLKLGVGDDNGALKAYEEMLLSDRRLVEIDDTNNEWQWNLSLSLDRFGVSNLNLGNLDAAASAYDESLAVRRRLADLDRSNSLWEEGASLMQKKIVDLECVVDDEAMAFAEGTELRTDQSCGADRVGSELEELLSLNAEKIRKVKKAAVGKVQAAYKGGLAIARNLVQQSSKFRVREALRTPSAFEPSA